MDSDKENVIELLYGGSSNFEKIAKTFTVMDIADPVDELDGGLTFIKAWLELGFSSADYQYAVIKKSEKAFYYVDLRGGELSLLAKDFTEKYNANTGKDIDFIFDINDQELEKIDITELATPLTIDYIVGNTTPILSVFHHFITKNVAFIIEDDKITHAVRFIDFDKMPVKLCLFSLMLELESSMSNLLKKQPNLDQYIKMLPENSLENLKIQAKRHFKHKKEISALELLKFTNLKEKHTMIREHLTTEHNEVNSLSSCDEYFYDLQQLRNNIANGVSILSIIDTPETFNKYILNMLYYINIIYKTKK